MTATQAGIIGAILVASIALGFVNEYRAERATAALHSRVRHTALVRRNRCFVKVDVVDLVIGDVIRHALGEAVLAGERHNRARGSTLRRRIINVPARLARPQRRPILYLPTHWPWSKHWLTLWHNTIAYSPPVTI